MSSVALVVWGVLFFSPVQAQITITETDVRTLIGGTVHVQSFEATTPANFSDVFGQSGANQTYDLRSKQFQTAFPALFLRQAFDPATPPDTPRADAFAAEGANIVNTAQMQTVLGNAGSPTDSLFWIYERVDADTVESYGSVFISRDDLDQDGDDVDTLSVSFDGAQTSIPLPVTDGDAWQDFYTFRTSVDGVPTGSSSTFAVDAEVVGYGTLRTPSGDAEVLQIERDQTQQTSIGGVVIQTSRTIQMEWRSLEGRLAATVSYNQDTGEVVTASYTVLSDEAFTTEVAAGETPSVDQFGASVTVTQNSSTEAASLGLYRYDGPPVNQTFSGSATGDDGTTITPNTMWNERYYVVEAPQLTSFSAEVCLETSDVPGVNDLQTLVLVTRPDASSSWTPIASTLQGTRLCASGLTSFSQFGIASDATLNPLPVELTRFDATVDDADALLRWQTASETNNAGFTIQHRTPVADTWHNAAFVNGKGTTNETTTYRYRAADLAPGTHVFRLEQVDHDGATTLSESITVDVLPSETNRVVMGQNPVRHTATAIITLQEQQTVRATVYDLLGRKMRTIHAGPVNRGVTKLQADVNALPNGRYFLRLEGDTFEATKSFVVVR